MQRTNIGKIEVSRLGLGTVKFGRNMGVKYPHGFELPTDKEISHLLSIANELGINLLDTAPAYGISEERLGRALCGQRQNWVISTKAGEEFIDGKSVFDFSPASMIASVERSLKRLHTDYIDIVLVHSNGDDQLLIEQEHVFTALETLKKAGKIRAYGMSTKTVQGGLLTVALADVAMVTFNPSDTEDKAIILEAEKLKKGILVKKALRSGHLTRPPEENIKFILEEPGVSSVIVGTINPKHLRENAAVFCECEVV